MSTTTPAAPFTFAPATLPTFTARDLAAMNPDLDPIDLSILTERYTARRATEHVMAGDVVNTGGALWRVGHARRWPGDPAPEHFATMSAAGIDVGSHHLAPSGAVDTSGTFRPGRPVDVLTPAGVPWLWAPVWFFHHNRPAAGGGVRALVPVRVWRAPAESD